MMSRTTASIPSIVLAALALLLSVGTHAHAADIVSVGPPILELVGKPGETLRVSATVTNPGDTPLNASISAGDFSYDAKGTLHFVEPADEPHDVASMKEWIVPSVSSISLEANGRKEIPYEIRIPRDAVVGGHTGTLYVLITPTQSEGSVITSLGRAAQIILLDVGKVRRTARLTDASATPYGSGALLSYTMLNTGNAAFIPAGTIRIRDVFRREVDIIDVQEARGSSRLRAFPNVSRTFTQRWDPLLAAGSYSVTFTLLDGEGKILPPVTRSVTVVPWGAIHTALVGIRAIW